MRGKSEVLTGFEQKGCGTVAILKERYNRGGVKLGEVEKIAITMFDADPNINMWRENQHPASWSTTDMTLPAMVRRVGYSPTVARPAPPPGPGLDTRSAISPRTDMTTDRMMNNDGVTTQYKEGVDKVIHDITLIPDEQSKQVI